jgi:hypothetical protein
VLRFITNPKFPGDSYLYGIGLEPGNLDRLLGGEEIVLRDIVPNITQSIHLCVFAGKDQGQLAERLKAMFPDRAGETVRLPVLKFDGPLYVTVMTLGGNNLLYLLGLDGDSIKSLRAGTLLQCRMRQSHLQGPSVRFVVCHAENPEKLEQEFILSGLVGGNTQWERPRYGS